MSAVIFTNGKIILRDKILNSGSVVVRKGVIEEVLKKGKQIPKGKEIDLKGNFLSPGFIDLHVHGALGCDAMQANLKAWNKISRFHASKGTAHFALTTTACRWNELERVLKLAKQKPKLSGAQLLGIHIEGPFLAKEKAGAHRVDLLHEPLRDEWEKLLKYSDVITQVTLAPELRGAKTLIRELKKRNIIASAGHTDATEAEMKQACLAGLDNATHLYNRMAAIDKTNPKSACDAVKFILNNRFIYAEIIADGIHVPIPLLKETVHRKGVDKLILITDATAGAGLSIGKIFSVGYHIKAKVHRNCARTCDTGVLAGSTIGMIDAVKIMTQKVGIPLYESIRMATVNPARRIGQSNKGVIQEGTQANLIIFNSQYKILKAF